MLLFKFRQSLTHDPFTAGIVIRLFELLCRKFMKMICITGVTQLPSQCRKLM